MVFLGKPLAFLAIAKLNASHYVRYSAACFSLKNIIAGYFVSFWPGVLKIFADKTDFDHARESRHAVTSFVRLSSIR